jgi:hypothetical protein
MEKIGEQGDLECINSALENLQGSALLNSEKPKRLLACMQGLIKGGHHGTPAYQLVKARAEEYSILENDIIKSTALAYAQAGNFEACQENGRPEPGSPQFSEWAADMYTLVQVNGYYKIAEQQFGQAFSKDQDFSHSLVNSLVRGGHIVYLSHILDTLPPNETVTSDFLWTRGNLNYYLDHASSAYGALSTLESAEEFIARIPNDKLNQYYRNAASKSFTEKDWCEVGQRAKVRGHWRLGREAAVSFGAHTTEIIMLTCCVLRYSKPLLNIPGGLEAYPVHEELIGIPTEIQQEILSWFGKKEPLSGEAISEFYQLVPNRLRGVSKEGRGGEQSSSHELKVEENTQDNLQGIIDTIITCWNALSASDGKLNRNPQTMPGAYVSGSEEGAEKDSDKTPSLAGFFFAPL